jgi:hypothetical protein
MLVNITDLLLCPTSFPVPVVLTATEARARSILVIDQSEARESSCSPVFFGLRAAGNADGRLDTTLDAEHLDVSRFNRAAHAQSLRRHLKKRYHDRSIGVAAAVGAGTFELVLCSWPGGRIVLAMVDPIDFARSKLP